MQAARVKREAEEIYEDLLSVPADPKDLWDEEPVYDDTLTLEIPVEVPENSISKPSSPSSAKGDIVHVAGSGVVDNGAQAHEQMGSEQPLTGPTTSSVTGQPVDASNSAHDPNLLAILLNNPALVSQLTSQQNRNSSLDGLSALLEMVNKGSLGGLSVPTYAAGLGDMAQSRPGVSSGPASGSHLSGQLQLPTMEQVVDCLFVLLCFLCFCDCAIWKYIDAILNTFNHVDAQSLKETLSGRYEVVFSSPGNGCLAFLS